jgi:hypothetical protein
LRISSKQKGNLKSIIKGQDSTPQSCISRHPCRPVKPLPGSWDAQRRRRVIAKEINTECVTRRERSPFYTCLSTYRQDLPKSLHWINSIQAWSILLTSLLSLRVGVCNSETVCFSSSTSDFGPRPHFLQANIVFQRPRTPTNFLGYTSLLWALISPTTLTRHQPRCRLACAATPSSSSQQSDLGWISRCPSSIELGQNNFRHKQDASLLTLSRRIAGA